MAERRAIIALPAPRATAARGRRRTLGWAVVALLLSGWLAQLHNYTGWDKSFYLGQASSLVEDGDVDLRNDFLHLQRDPGKLLKQLGKTRPNGSLDNVFAIGTSVLALPAYSLTLPLRALGARPEARWSRVQLVALQLTALAAVLWLLWALDRWLRRMGVERWLAALGSLALVLGTPLAVYGLQGYTESHLASAVAVLWLLMAALRLARRPTPLAALLCGVALGMVFLCRWQDAVKGLVLVAPLLELARRGLPPGRWLRLGATAGTAALAVAGLQLHVWLLERGEIFGLPQGPGFLRLADPEIGAFLFSGLAGVVPWSPLFAVGLLGLLLPWRVRLPVAWRWIALVLLLFDVYLNASVVDWWGGAGYGPRRMSSDVPLLALGLGNLLVRRRLRLPAATVLAAVCLWGVVTVNLSMSGLVDLSILARGRPSAGPESETVTLAQPTRAEALAAATPWPGRFARMSYFDRRTPWGRALTVAIGALFCLLVGWCLSRPRAPAALAPLLLAVLAVVLFAHLRLLAGGQPDAAERRQWVELRHQSRAGRPGAAEPPPASLAITDLHADARRYVWACALARWGRRQEAERLAAELGPYPFVPRFLAALALPPGEVQLLRRTGFFYLVRDQRPSHGLTVARRVDPDCAALRLTVTVEPGPESPAPRGRLLALGRRGGPSLARVDLGAGSVALLTDSDRAEAALDWRPRAAQRLELDLDPAAARVTLALERPGSETVRLAATLPPAAAGRGRLEVLLGTPDDLEGYAPPRRTRFSGLLLTARDACAGERR